MQSEEQLRQQKTAEERRLFRLDDFPQTYSERRAFIFALTGFSAKPLDRRGWHLFNRSMNDGLRLGLDERSLQILSLMDTALAEVRRFRNMPHMHEIASDSTAAHTKQAMNIIQHIVERAAGDTMPPKMDALRRKAIIGTWVHDMGEIVMELTTASEVFQVPPEQRAELSEKKNLLERDLFHFGCMLAAHTVDSSQPDIFLSSIRQLREQAQAQPGIDQRIASIRSGMERLTARYGLASDETATTLLACYDEVEASAKGNFLHPFVKTLEAVEGQRYLQRNSGLQPHTRMELATSHDIIESCRRCEKRLGELYDAAGNDRMLQSLARRTAEYTYRSLARQFMPKQEDHVSLAPACIQRDATHSTEPASDTLFPASMMPMLRDHTVALGKRVATVLDACPPESGVRRRMQQELTEALSEATSSTLEATRSAYQATLAAAADSRGVNKPIYTRREAGLLYRAAERASVAKQGFVPQTASLICMKDTPVLPKRIEQMMRDIDREMQGTNKVVPLRGDQRWGR